MKFNFFGKTIIIRKEYMVVCFIFLLILLTLWGWYLKTNRIEVFSAVDQVASNENQINSVDRASLQKGNQTENTKSLPSMKDVEPNHPGGIPSVKSPIKQTTEIQTAENQTAENQKDSVVNMGLININIAGTVELTSLSGIGEVKANAIITYREENGAFQSIEEIKNVKGIGEATFNKIKDKITISD